VRQTKVKCEHCRGTGKCDCGSCGVDHGDTWSDGSVKLMEGKCTSCQGKGYHLEY